MTGIADVRRRFKQQARVIGAMGRMAFEAGADRSRSMEEIAFRKPFMAMGAELVCRNDEAGVSTLVMAVVTAFFGEGGVLGSLLDSLLFLPGF